MEFPDGHAGRGPMSRPDGPLIWPIGDANPSIAEDCWVAPGASILGAVTLGPSSSVWFAAVVRADQERIGVGAGSNIQDGCVLHADPGYPLTVGRGVTVGHAAVLHGCTIADGVLIGMGATVLNGAQIGSGSVVAAGAVVLGGTDIPEGSLVAGVPAKVRRSTSDDERRSVRASAETYVDLSRRYLEQARRQQ
jgi:carbonic anhydrase/acetyltransferase-like protein (isoleucine patch superfamily)